MTKKALKIDNERLRESLNDIDDRLNYREDSYRKTSTLLKYVRTDLYDLRTKYSNLKKTVKRVFKENQRLKARNAELEHKSEKYLEFINRQVDIYMDNWLKDLEL